MSEVHKENISLPQLIEDMEREYILEALKKTNWHRENAARLLGITRKMLGDRISKYELKQAENKCLKLEPRIDTKRKMPKVN